MVYKKYIKKGGKVFGPYYYESYRDKKGNVKTRFISGPKNKDVYVKKVKSINLKPVKRFFYAVFLISLILILPILFLGNLSYNLQSKHMNGRVTDYSASTSEVQLAEKIADNEVKSNVDLREFVNLSVDNKNKLMNFRTPSGKIELNFDLLNYSEFVEKKVESEVNSENFSVDMKESKEEYKWGYDIKLNNLNFIAKIDVRTNQILKILDNQTLKIGNNYISFAELVSQGYIISINEPKIITNETFETNINKNIKLINQTQKSLSQIITSEVIKPLTGFFVYGFKGISGLAFSENNNENYVSIYIQKDFSNSSYNIGDIINLDSSLIIIEISKAEHLDKDRVFISDIYESVKTKDNNWGEVIPADDFVRVIFNKNLTNKNDITLFAKSNNPAEISVYRKNDNTEIARFTNIGSEGWYKVYLTNLNEGENNDIFDLKVLNNPVIFDYIVDPSEPFSSDTNNTNEWWMFGRTLNHTAWDGVTFSNIGICNSTYETGNIITSSPIIVNGYVYVGSNDHMFYQLNASDISQNISKYETSIPITSSPAYANGYIYLNLMGVGLRTILQLNASNVSQLIANYSFGIGGGTVGSSPIIANDYVYFSRGDSDAVITYQFNASNVSNYFSNLTFKLTAFGANNLNTPVFAGDSIYIIGGNGSNNGIRRLNASDISQVLASYLGKNSTNILSSNTVWNDYLYVTTQECLIIQLNATSMDLIADFSLGGGSCSSYSSPAVANGYIYIGSNDKNVYQLNASNVSQLIANYTTGGSISSSPTVAYGYVYIGSNDNQIYQLNASNVSQLIANYTTGGDVSSSPAVANDYIYIGSSDNKIYQLYAYNISQTGKSCPLFSSSSDTTPPDVYLLAPPNNTITNIATHYFSANVTDNIYVTNMTLYVWNSTKDIIHTTTNFSCGMTAPYCLTNISFTIPYEGNFTWNYLACDDAGNCSWNNTNWTLIYDITPPIVNITYPQNTSYRINISTLEYTSNEIGYCWYSNSFGVWNSTIVAASTTFTNVTTEEGSNTLKVYCNDTAGNQNSSSVTFVKDTIYPSFSNYSDNSGTLTSNGTAWFNVNVLNSNGTVLLQINDANTSATNLTSDINTVSVSLSSAGTYSYKWISWGSGVLHNLNTSETRSYIINSSACTSTGCSGNCGSYVDNCGNTLDCGSCGGGGGGGEIIPPPNRTVINRTCYYFYWFDNRNNNVCGYKQFCDSYYYLGLQTFSRLEDCEGALPKIPSEENKTEIIPESKCGEWTKCKVIYSIEDLINNNVILKGEQTRQCYDENTGLVNRIEEKNCEIISPIYTQKNITENETTVTLYDNSTNEIVSIISLTPEQELNINIIMNTEEQDHCYDGIKNYDEDEKDCSYSSDGSCPVCFNQKTEGCRIELTKGLNLISICVNLKDYSFSSILKNIGDDYDYILEFDDINKEYKLWKRGGTQEFNGFNQNKSYFIYYTGAPKTIYLNGTYFGNINLPVHSALKAPFYPYEKNSLAIKPSDYYNSKYDYILGWDKNKKRFTLYNTEGTREISNINTGEGLFLYGDVGMINYIPPKDR